MSISLFRSLAGQYQDMREINTTSMMNTISHHIEDQVINHRLPVDFFAGFQRFSLFPDQLDRYRRLGEVCRRVYVFGVADVRPQPIPGVEFIALDPTSPLADEWFVVVDTPLFWSVLSTQEVEGVDPITGRRRFDGLWSFDEIVADRASLLLSQALNGYYNPIKNRDFSSQNQQIAEITNRMVGSLERSRVKVSQQRNQMNSIRQLSTRLGQNGDILGLVREAAQMLHASFVESGVVISLLDQNNRLVVLVAEGESSAKDMSLHNGLGPSKEVIDSGKLLHLPDLTQTPQRDPYLPTAQTLVAAPIVGSRRVHGSVVIGSRQADYLTAEDARTVQAVASLLAIPLDAPQQMNGNAPALGSGFNEEKLKAPLAYLLTMNRKLRTMNGIQQQHVELIDKIEKLSVGIAQTVGVPEDTIRRILSQ